MVQPEVPDRTSRNGAVRGTSDFHLVESRGAWRLAINATPRLLAVLAGEHAADGSFTVQVEPNLLPSGPFDVAIDVASGATSDGAATEPERSAR